MEKYQRAEKLGAGGMGEVWKAWDPELRRWVALKLLKEEDPELLARFRREAEMSARLSHPHIAAVYEAGDRYIAMQLIPGRTLDQMPGNDPRRIVTVIRQVALAIHYAHEQGIIHRDLKPANIMVTDDGHAYVMDFGLAKTTASSFSMSGAILGTPNYMSPEQARGERRIDPRTDLYSLGATLYELLSGHPPLYDEQIHRLLARIITEEPPPLRRVDPELSTIVMKCLEKEPGRRYRTADELARDLDRWLRGEPIRAHPPSAFYRFGKLVRRQRVMIATAAVVLALAGAGWILSSGIARDREYERRRSEAEAHYAAGRWEDARVSAERALEIREDGSLRELARSSSDRLATAERGKARKLEEAERRRSLEETMRPIEALIAETRPHFYIASADIVAKLDEVRAALRRLDLVVAENDGHADAWRLLGTGWYFVGDLAKAESALLRAADLAPEDPAVHHHLVRIYCERMLDGFVLDRRGKIGAAVEGRTQAAATKAEKYLPAAGGSELDRAVLDVYRAIVRREREPILKLCRSALERFEGTMGAEELWFLLGVSERSPRDRIESLTRALLQRPHYPLAYVMRGRNRDLVEDDGGALADFNAAIRIRPDFAEAWHYRGCLQWWAFKDADAAIRDFTEAIRLDPDNDTAWWMRGHVYHNGKKDPDTALPDYDEAIRINPDHYWAYLDRGLLREQTGDEEGAIQDYGEMIRLNQGSPLVYHNRGELFGKRRRYAESIADMTQAGKLNPRYACAFICGARFRVLSGDLEGALQTVERGIALDPTRGDAYMIRGDARAGRHEFDAACADYLRAYLLYPEEDPARESLRTAYRRILDSPGRMDNAVGSFLRGRLAYREGDREKGRDLYEQGLARMTPEARKEMIRDPALVKLLSRVHFDLACYLGSKGRHEEAYRQLELIFETGSLTLSEMEAAPELEKARRFPGWTDLVAKTKEAIDIGTTLSGMSDAPLRVSRLEPGGPADRAGLRVGDTILAIDVHDIGSGEALIHYARHAPKDRPLRLLVERDGKELEILVTPLRR